MGHAAIAYRPEIRDGSRGKTAPANRDGFRRDARRLGAFFKATRMSIWPKGKPLGEPSGFATID